MVAGDEAALLNHFGEAWTRKTIVAAVMSAFNRGPNTIRDGLPVEVARKLIELASCGFQQHSGFGHRRIASTVREMCSKSLPVPRTERTTTPLGSRDRLN